MHPIPKLAPAQTVPSRMVYHEINTAPRPLANMVQTQEQRDGLVEPIAELRSLYKSLNDSMSFACSADQYITRSVQVKERLLDQVRDPPIIKNKSRSRDARLAAAREGLPYSGGGSGRRKCGVCWEYGHNRVRCPMRSMRPYNIRSIPTRFTLQFN